VSDKVELSAGETPFSAGDPADYFYSTEDAFVRLVKLNPYFSLEVMRALAERLQAGRI